MLNSNKHKNRDMNIDHYYNILDERLGKIAPRWWFKPATLRSTWQVTLLPKLCSSGISAPRLGHWMVECMNKDIAVTFSVILGEPNLRFVLHLPKQQHPAAKIIALRYKCQLWSFESLTNGRQMATTVFQWILKAINCSFNRIPASAVIVSR